MHTKLIYVNRLHLTECNPVLTPMLQSTKLLKCAGNPLPNPTVYRSTVTSLQYFTLAHPDIAFAINKLSPYLHSPTDLHCAPCKHLLCYLFMVRVILLYSFLVLWLRFLQVFSMPIGLGLSMIDVQLVVSVYLGLNLILWSSWEIGCCDLWGEIPCLSFYCWLNSSGYSRCAKCWHFLPLFLLCCGVIIIGHHLASNPVFHVHTKHIEVDVHFTCEKVENKIIDIWWCSVCWLDSWCLHQVFANSALSSSPTKTSTQKWMLISARVS